MPGLEEQNGPFLKCAIVRGQRGVGGGGWGQRGEMTQTLYAHMNK
jgi:hypothetical protein